MGDWIKTQHTDAKCFSSMETHSSSTLNETQPPSPVDSSTRVYETPDEPTYEVEKYTPPLEHPHLGRSDVFDMSYVEATMPRPHGHHPPYLHMKPGPDRSAYVLPDVGGYLMQTCPEGQQS